MKLTACHGLAGKDISLNRQGISAECVRKHVKKAAQGHSTEIFSLSIKASEEERY